MLEVEMRVSSRQVESIAMQTIKHRFPLYSAADRIWCRSTPIALELNYQIHSPIREVNLDSNLQLYLYPSEAIVWVAHLFITQNQRRRGMGRSLAYVAEAIAQSLGSRLIRVHAMYEAQAFWEHLGYRLAMGNAGILEKELTRPDGD